MTSGTEVGQVFVRVNVNGDALSVLKDIEEQMLRITRVAGVAGSAQSSSVQISPQASQSAMDMAQSLREVSVVAPMATQSINTYTQSLDKAQKVTKAQAITARIVATETSQLKIVQSQNAASAGDFTSAMNFALEALDDLPRGTNQYQFALKNLNVIMQQTETQSRTFAKAVADGGAALIKTSIDSSSFTSSIDRAFDIVNQKIKQYTDGMDLLQAKTEMAEADGSQLEIMHSTLGKAFDQNVVKIMNLAKNMHGLDEAMALGKRAVEEYGDSFRGMGVDLSETIALLKRFETEKTKLDQANAKKMEASEFAESLNIIKDARIMAQFNGTIRAINMLEQEVERYNIGSRAGIAITREIIRLEGIHADALTKTAIASAKAYEKIRNYGEGLRVAERRLEEINSGQSRGSLAATEELQNVADRLRIQQQSPRNAWWDGPLGQLRNFSGTVLAITGAFYTLRDAIATTFQALQAGAELSVTEAQMKLLVTSTEEYKQVLEATSLNIQLFGGSLQTTLADMNRLVILSNQTGASVELLNQAVLLLSAKDPQQGAAGAVIALNEALAEGQTISLRRRFELVGSSIGYFTDETISSNEKIQRLIATLSDMGVSMDLLEGSVGDAARTVNELGSVSEEMWARIGQALSVSLTDELRVLTDALKYANAELAEYARKNEEINQAKVDQFTPEQMLHLTGTQRLIVEVMQVVEAQKILARETELTSEAFLQGAANAEAYRVKIEPLIRAVEEKSAATIEYIKNTLESAETQARQADIMKELVDMSVQVADGHMSAADASSALQTKYGELGISVDSLRGMFIALAAQSRETSTGLAADAATAAAAWQRQMSEVVRAAQLIGKEGSEAARIRLQQLREERDLVLPGYENAPERARIAVDIKQAELDLQREINQETKNAEELAVDWAVATGNVLPELERARKEYNRIMSVAGSATEAEKRRALELAGIIRTLEGALDVGRPSGGGGGGDGAARLSDQDKLNNQLALDQLKADQQAEDALIAHEDRMLEIRKDYAERTLRAIEKYQEDQKAGRASFYESLTGIEDHGLQKAMSAQFEAAALEAGKIAQTLGPDVAAQFLQQMQKNITDQAKRQQDINKALNKNSDDFNPALAEYLQGVDQLFRVSEQGAINQILRARDSLAMSEQEATQDAEQKYIDALAKISDTAAESAERRIEAVRLAGKEIDLEIAKVQELGATYEKIGFMPGSQRTVALQGNAPDPMAGVSESLAAIAGDITSVLNAIRSNTGDTASAVRRLSPSVTQ